MANTPTQAEPAPGSPFDSKTPVPITHRSPVRFAINGKQHMVGELQGIIATTPGMTPEYAALIQSEIARRTTPAARVDLHVVDHDDGGTSVHIHIKPIALG